MRMPIVYNSGILCMYITQVFFICCTGCFAVVVIVVVGERQLVKLSIINAVTCSKQKSMRHPYVITRGLSNII